MAAGGGGHGGVAGIAHGLMILAGSFIKVFRLGMQEYILIGEIITELVCGEVIGGIIVEYLIMIFIGIGKVGMIEGIGETIEIGVLKAGTFTADEI
ncbi:MAG: hypothetical protein A2026_00760 [Deltaproteobacteria bacterium RBG_19FT_COMBO_46_12]|nr:MAG: hypothetical protein A2026_00760 [Deltaproteobacteria bacterium RBG_19FT_COMBO_46_12]